MNININFNLKLLKKILNQIKSLEIQMSIIADALSAARINLDVQAAGVEATLTLVKEVKQLLLENNTAAAIDLLDTIAANAPALSEAIVATDALTAEVDAINGEPVEPVVDPAA